MPASSPPISMPVPVRSDGEHSAAGRHLVLHVYPGRVPGRLYRGKVAPCAAAALCAARQLLSASDRGTDPSPQGYDPAIRSRRIEAPGRASDPVRPDHFRDRPVQEDLPCRRRPAAGRARIRPDTAVIRSGLDRGAGLYLPALLRFLRLFRHGNRNFADVRHLPAAQFQLAPSTSGGAGT